MSDGRNRAAGDARTARLARRLLAVRGRLPAQIAQRAERSDGVVEQLLGVARAAGASNPRAAERAARLAKALAKRRRVSPESALSAHALGRVVHRMGRFAEADVQYQEALEGYRRAGLSSESLDVETARIGTLFRLGRLADATRLGRRVLAKLGQHGGSRTAMVLVNLAYISHARDRHNEAVSLLEKARRLTGSDRALAANVDTNLALSYSVMARFNRSVPLFEAARLAYAELGQSVLVAQVEYNLAYDHFLQGRLHEARRTLDAARAAFRAVGARHGLALASLDEAEMALAVGDAPRADEAARQARNAFVGAGLPLESARACLLEAVATAASRGTTARVVARLEEARLGFRKAKNRAGLGAVELAWAGTLSRPLAERERKALRAAAIFRASSLPAREGTALALAGSLAVERGAVVRGRGLLGRALASARKRGLAEVELRAEQGLARAESGLRQPQKALARYRRAIGAYERLRAGMRSDEDRLAFASDKASVFREAIVAALDAGRVEEAFGFVERARARSLVDLLASDDRVERAALARGGRLARRLEALKRDLERLDPRGGGHTRRAATVSSALGARLKRLVLERDQALRAFAHEEPETSYAISGFPVASLDAVRATLGSDRALLTYVDEGESLGALLLTSAGLRAYRGICGKVSLVRALAGLRFALHPPRVEDARNAAHSRAQRGAAEAALGELHALLLGSIEKDLGDRALVVVPTAGIHVVPFHALGPAGRALLEEREVTMAPSATVLVHAAARAPKTEGAFVLASADTLAPAIGEEARFIAKRLGARLVEGTDATAEALRTHGTGARIVHLAAHGVYEPHEPLWSGLELADGRLTLPEVAGLGLDAALVTLSACESGLGQSQGDEVLGLTRAFLQAGTKALVASLWSVQDTATRELMTVFYEGLVGGEGAGAALRKAALEVRRERPHPYDWAPFVLLGDWRNVGGGLPVSPLATPSAGTACT